MFANTANMSYNTNLSYKYIISAIEKNPLEKKHIIKRDLPFLLI